MPVVSVRSVSLNEVIARLELQDEMERVDGYMKNLASSPVLTVSEPARHVISAGGKRLRAMLVLLAAKLNRYDPSKAVAVASAVELIHAASLVHDDLIDQSPRRRGLTTVHTKWFRDAALVGGDYLFALSATAIARSGDIRVLDCLGRAAVRICEGEISLVQNVSPLDQALEAYFFKIGGKTAVLFEEGLKAAGVISGASEVEIEALGRYGHNVGMAFQITDDLLDYVGDPTVIGKPVGGDLRRRQITLPLIYAAADGMSPTLRTTIDRIDDGATLAEVEELLAWVQRSIGIEQSQQKAQHYCQQACDALQTFPPSAARDALEGIAWFVLERRK
ncbi:MAG: polyprenyl synthetase family protein [Anaerolineales bacterium]|nr:MAG: polyprenyl synthetase family protein [Anaerolineales bacterium]